MGTDLAQARKVKLWWKLEGEFPAAADDVLLGLNVRNELGVDRGSVITVDGETPAGERYPARDRG